jgi:hypothetical protein
MFVVRARVPRPVPRVAAKPPPQLVCLPTSELHELPATPPSVPPPLPARPKEPISGRMPVARPARQHVSEALSLALRDLDAQHDSLFAARLCIEALAAVTPCRVLAAHAFDTRRREFVVVHAKGDRADTMVLTRHPSSDPLLRIAMPKGEPFAWPDLRKAPMHSIARYAELRGVKTVLVAPVLAGTRWLGSFELIDPFYGAPFRTEDALSARYVAHRYAQFVSSRGLTLDTGAIARFANAHFSAGKT